MADDENVGGLTVYMVDKIMDHVFRGVAWTPPSIYYASMHLDNPSDSGLLYPSAQTTREALTLAPSAGGYCTITSDLNWLLTADESVAWLALWDASTGGHCCATAKLGSAVNLFLGDTMELPSLTIGIPAGA